MAVSKRNIRWVVHMATDAIYEYLLKCLVIQDLTNNLRNWKKDLYSFLPGLPKLKFTKKFPSAKLIYNWFNDELDDAILEHLDSDIEYLNDDENTNITEYNKQSLYDNIMSYFKWISEQLSKGEVDKKMLSEKIDELIQSYNSSIRNLNDYDDDLINDLKQRGYYN